VKSKQERAAPAIAIRQEVKFILCPKYPNFRYHGNKGQPGTDFNGAIGSAVLENPLLGANISALSAIEAEYTYSRPNAILTTLEIPKPTYTRRPRTLSR